MDIVKRAVRRFKEEGARKFFHLVMRKLFSGGSSSTQYKRWIRQMEKDHKEDVSNLKYQPLISIVVPVYNVKSDQLRACIESVIQQSYSNWQLCLVDDCSTMDSVKELLNVYENHPKIKIKYRTKNGHISQTTNDGIAMSDGEFVGLLDCDDLIAQNALLEVVKMLNCNEKYDYIYSDEDLITEDGKKRYSPFFKPDWSPDTLMSMMYTGHLSIYRKSILEQIGGLRIGYDGAQDYDLVLRFTEQTKEIGHIDQILYHWRARKESTANDPKNKMYAYDAAKRAKQDAMKRRGLSADLEFLPDEFQWRVNYHNPAQPLVSIIIPSKDNPDYLNRCLHSLFEKTEYPNFEIIVVDNGSNSDNKKKYEELCAQFHAAYHYEEMGFNFSRMCNLGAAAAKGEYLLFLNDDIEIKNGIWLERMVGQASLAHVGAVGAKLLYPDSMKIQHAGVINYGIGPGHPLMGARDDLHYYYCRNVVEYNYLAVTGACLMVNKEKFDQIQGFDESFPVAYNDVDLCFRLVERGYYNVLRNDAVLYHHESVSRGLDAKSMEKRERLDQERARLYKKHPCFKGRDPFYNKNLAQDKGDYSINPYPKEKMERNV